MLPYGSLCFLIGPYASYGFQLVLMGPYKSGLYGSLQVLMDPIWSLCVFIGFYSSPWILMAPNGSL